MRSDSSDAACLRDAAWILRTRATKRTFMLRAVTRFLELAANKIDQAAEWDAITGRGTSVGRHGAV